MKSNKIYFIVITLLFVTHQNFSQINLGERLIGAAANGLKALTFSNEDASALSLQAVTKMDKDNPVAGPKDAYTIRLNKVFGKHATENGLKLNYKVYKLKDVNAFATADGSVRVFAGLMDIMDDNELLAVIGHEIGHVANEDSKDAMKAAYGKQALIDGAASQSDKIASMTDSQLGQIGKAMWDSKHSRQQETDADLFSYDFMKRNGYNVNAVESAFNILAKMGAGGESNFITQMMSSHPDPADRAQQAKEKATDDGLYNPYVKNVKSKAKATVKKPIKKK